MRSGLAGAPPSDLAPPEKHAHETHEEGEVHGQKVVRDQRVTNALDLTAEQIPRHATDVESPLGQEHRPVDEALPQERAGQEHADQEQGQDPPQQLV